MVNLLPIHTPEGGVAFVNQVEIPSSLTLRGDGDAFTLEGDSEAVRAILHGRTNLPDALQTSAEE